MTKSFLCLGLALLMLAGRNTNAAPAPASTLLPVFQNGKWGFIDATGALKIAPIFDKAQGFSEGLAPVALNLKTGYTGPDGKPEIGPKYGYIDTTGKIVIAPKYRYGFDFSEGLAWVDDIDGPSGFIDHDGKMRLQAPGGFYCREFRDGLALAQPYLPSGAAMIAPVPPGFERRAEEPRRVGFIDKTGNWAIEPKFESAWDFSEGLAAVLVEKEWGFIDKTGALVIPARFDGPGVFSGGIAAVTSEGKTSFIGRDGRRAIAAQYDEAQGFHEGLAAVRVEGKWGFINTNGDTVIAPRFGNVASFFGGRAGFKQDGKWGYIDKTGAIVVAPLYPEVHFFTGELAMVTFNPRQGDARGRGYIDKSGDVVWAPQFPE